MKKCIVLITGMLLMCGMSNAGLLGPSADSAQTVALWHLDSTYVSDGKTYFPDDDALFPRTNSELQLQDTTNAVLATAAGEYKIGTGSLYVNGAATTTGYTLATGLDYLANPVENLSVDMWYNARTNMLTSSVHYLVMASSYRLYLNTAGSILSFMITDSLGGTNTVNAAVIKGAWLHITAEFDNGQLSLVVNNEDGTLRDSQSVSHTVTTLQTAATSDIRLGSYATGTNSRAFRGYIDEVSICVPEPATFALLGVGMLLFRKKA